jgi:tetratricopeptide (TPR) repeat protein
MTQRLGFRIVLGALFIAVSLPLFGQTAADYIRQGDEYYAKFDNAQARQEYLKAVKEEPGNYEALWKTSRAYYDVADQMTVANKKEAEEQRALYGEAMRYARQAIKADPNDASGHFFLSAAWGKYVLTQGKKEQVSAAKQIKAEIEKAIELDPNNDLAYHALGRWQRRMAEIGGAQRFFGGILYGNIPKGSYEEAVKDFQKAIELNPKYCNNYLELGRTYLDMKKYDLAKQEFEKTLEAPITTSKDEMFKKEAQAELDALKKEGK